MTLERAPATAPPDAEAYHADSVGPAERLDPRTAADLDLDGVLGAIDRTASVIGRQRLYHRLRTTTPTPDRAADRTLAARFRAEPELRRAAGRALARLTRPAAGSLWRLTRPDAVPVERWFLLFPLLALAVVASLAALPSVPHAFPALVLVLLINLGVRAVIWLRLAGLVAPLGQVEPLLRAAADLLTLPAVAEAMGSRFDRSDLARLAPLRRVARWIARDPSTTGEAAALVAEYVNLVLLLDANALLLSARTLRRHRESLRRVIDGLGDVDLVLATTLLEAEGGWSRPELGSAGPLELVSGHHPLVPEPTPNAVALDPGAGLLLTGANMSGKTTLVRTVGLAALLAQTIDLSPAARYRAPWLRIRTSIGQADDLRAGKSYHRSEVEAVLDLIRAGASTTPHLLLFDELFRGTNTVERLAAGAAVLAALVPPGSPHRVIAATHDAELVELLRGRYRVAHFAGVVDSTGLRFDFRLRPGLSRERTAIALLEHAGAPPELVARARELAAALDANRRPALEPSVSEAGSAAPGDERGILPG